MDMAMGVRTDFIWRDAAPWREFMMERYPGVEVSGPRSGFRTRYQSWSAGGVEFAEIESASRQCICVTTPARDAPDCYYLPLQLAGQFRGGQHGRECDAGPRKLYLLDSHAPHWRVLSDGSRLLNVRLPKELVNHHLTDPAASCMRPVDARTGQAALVWDFAHSVWQRRDELGAALPRMAAVLAVMAADLFGTATPGTDSVSSAAARQRRLLLQCIDDHLRDPCFNVMRAAECCGISPRYVHLLMRGTGRTFGQRLLERRLAKCREEIRAAAGQPRSLTDIAFAWGFNDISHFSRAFRSRYRRSPREFRRACRGRSH